MEKNCKKKFEIFLNKYRPIKLKKGEIVYQPGSYFDSSLYIKSGHLRSYGICKNGQEVTISIFKPGSFLPTFWYPAKIKGRYYTEALTNAEIIRIPSEEAFDFLSSEREILQEIAAEVFFDYRDLTMKVESLASGDAYTRVIAVILSLVDEKKSTPQALDVAITHRLIASMTGLTRETVTLQILKLKKQGFISGKGRHLVVTDASKLKEEGCFQED